MAIDHAHEQNNKLVKGDGGAIGLTDNSAQLLRWMVSGPEVARVIQEFETSVESGDKQTGHSHHEQMPATQEKFQKQVQDIFRTIEEYGNPFCEGSQDLLVLDTHDITDVSVHETVYGVLEAGKKQYSAFVSERLQNRDKSVFDPIPQNKFALYSCPKPREVSKDRQHVASLKQNCSLFSQLYISCQVRNGDLDDFFRHENQDNPPSLSHFGQLRSGSKADLLKCLEKCAPVDDVSHEADVLLIDGAALVNMLQPGAAKTFREYADLVFIPYIKSNLEKVRRLDIVWDCYVQDSLKACTRNRRGKGLRRRVEPNTNLPGNWSLFLREEDNKKELFLFLAEELSSLPNEKDIISTHGCDIIHNLQDDNSVEFICPCSHEEADTRLILHMADASQKGFKSVAIRTVDTDVVVLAVSSYYHLALEQLWIVFGTGVHTRYIAAHAIAGAIGQ